MKRNKNFHILFLFNNESLYREIVDILKNRFVELPFQFSLIKDSTSALNQFQKDRHDLVIIDNDIPNLNWSILNLEFKKIKGSVGVFNFGKDASLEKNNLYFKIPVNDWTAFLIQFYGHVPEEMRIQFGPRMDELKGHAQYFEYASQFVQINSDFGQSQIDLKIPAHFQEGLIKKNLESLSPVKSLFEIKELTLERNRFEYFFVGILLIGLISFTFYSFQHESFESDRLLSIRNSALFLSTIGLVSFLLILPVNKMLIKILDS
jgi:hypothetical protein